MAVKSLLDVVAEVFEDFNDIKVVLCAAFEKSNSIFFGECLAFCFGNLALRILAITLIPNNYF